VIVLVATIFVTVKPWGDVPEEVMFVALKLEPVVTLAGPVAENVIKLPAHSNLALKLSAKIKVASGWNQRAASGTLMTTKRTRASSVLRFIIIRLLQER
jgi:hypothetical protein